MNTTFQFVFNYNTEHKHRTYDQNTKSKSFRYIVFRPKIVDIEIQVTWYPCYWTKSFHQYFHLDIVLVVIGCLIEPHQLLLPLTFLLMKEIEICTIELSMYFHELFLSLQLRIDHVTMRYMTINYNKKICCKMQTWVFLDSNKEY